MTTTTAGQGSAALSLRADPKVRDIQKAAKALRATASLSENKTNAPGYQTFLDATPGEQEETLTQVTILDGSPTITELDEALHEEVCFSVVRKNQDAFLERLEGWWFRRVIQQLAAAPPSRRILAAELEAEMDELREQFKREALPVDDDLILHELDDATQAAHDSSMFVRQLELIRAGTRRISGAIHDYYRAFEQRSRWNRNELLFVGELDKYEHRLSEEWERCFERVHDELGVDAADDAKRAASLRVLAWAETVSLPIRPGVTEPFVTRGSFHMLADRLRVGWHAEFRDRLAALVARGVGQ